MPEIRRASLAGAVLYGIVDYGYVEEAEMPRVCQELISGGADVIQLRAKGISQEKVRETAEVLLRICRPVGIPFILNDYPQIASDIGADGVHIGQDDGDLSRAREIVGNKMLIGRSTHSLAQAKQALVDGADYIGFGPLFPTPTKEGRPAIGLEDIAAVEEAVGKIFSVFCIGGIKQENLNDVLGAGARRCVIVSALLKGPDISAATRAAKKALSHT